jgi:hypothetical protein
MQIVSYLDQLKDANKRDKMPKLTKQKQITNQKAPNKLILSFFFKMTQFYLNSKSA